MAGQFKKALQRKAEIFNCAASHSRNGAMAVLEEIAQSCVVAEKDV
jgi:hypothetical protein